MAIYLFGLALCAISMRDFARPDANGMNTKGLYRYSRNPMYVAYFVCFLGIAFLTKFNDFHSDFSDFFRLRPTGLSYLRSAGVLKIRKVLSRLLR